MEVTPPQSPQQRRVVFGELPEGMNATSGEKSEARLAEFDIEGATAPARAKHNKERD